MPMGDAPDNIIKLQGPQLKLLGQAIIYKVPSRTRTGLHHYVIIRISEGLATEPLPEPVVECSCPGWQYNHGDKGDGACWHVDAALTQLQADTEAQYGEPK